MLRYWFKAAKILCSIGFLLNSIWPFYIQLLETRSEGRWASIDGTFLHFSHLFPCWVSACGVPPDSLRSSPVAAAAAFRDVNISDRSTASAAAICRWVITFGLPQGFGRFTTVTRPTGVENKEKSKREENTPSDTAAINCNHNWGFDG